MIKLIIPDIDGMLILTEEEFSKAFPKKFNIGSEEVTKLFTSGDFKKCQLGELDLRETIKEKYSKQWNVSEEDVFSFWFNTGKINEELIETLKKIKRENNIKIALGTNQEKYRLKEILKRIKAKEWIDGSIASCEIHLLKPNEEFYQKIIEKFPEINKNEVLIFDDREENIISLKNLGFNAEKFEGNSKFKEIIKKYKIKIYPI